MKNDYSVWVGDCLEVMRNDIQENSIDSIVTDPPYGLLFMGKDWDHGVPGNPFWEEALRVAKPGAYLLAFGGTRTYHRLACAIEDAGWEIRDCLMWVYGSGFPKSHDVSKAIDKEAGEERTEVIGERHRNVKPYDDENGWNQNNTTGSYQYTAPATEAAKEWDGWGTALKPAWEPVILARKPLEGTVAANVQKWGTGAINIDGCRVYAEPGELTPRNNKPGQNGVFNASGGPVKPSSLGRWPANLIHDGSEEVMGMFPQAGNGWKKNYGEEDYNGRQYGGGVFGGGGYLGGSTYCDSGSAARFFYCAKASRRERDAGTETNNHPTVKPISLMCYLVKLVTRKGGLVLDPFMGSGSTGCACMEEGMNFIGIEQNAEYATIAKKRIKHYMKEEDR